MFITSRVHRGFTLVELLMTFIILAVLAAIAIPAYDTVVKSSQADAATTTLDNIARNAQSLASANNITLPTNTNVSAAIIAVSGFTGRSSTVSAPNPSTAYKVVSYDVVDSSSVSPNAVGMAMQSGYGGCVMALI